jgi:TetR/AcrR family transcriptional regulator, cholesterol catabolism regulator
VTSVRDNPEFRGKSGEILDAFTRSVARDGYEGTSFTIIAAELGISRGLIAHHFGTKERLLSTLHASYMRRRVDEAIRIVSALATPAEQLAGLLYASIVYQTHDRDATVAFQREVARFAKEDEDSEGSKLRAEYSRILRDVIDAGVASGEFGVVDTNTRSLLIFGAARWAWTWFRPEGPRSVEQIGAELVDLVLGSLLVTRRRLARLANPDGEVVATVRAILAADDAGEGGFGGNSHVARDSPDRVGGVRGRG